MQNRESAHCQILPEEASGYMKQHLKQHLKRDSAFAEGGGR